MTCPVCNGTARTGRVVETMMGPQQERCVRCFATGHTITPGGLSVVTDRGSSSPAAHIFAPHVEGWRAAPARSDGAPEGWVA